MGVTRQTIYAIEAGSYVPNTAVALKLARVLESTIEDLFTLPEDSARPTARGDRVRFCPDRRRRSPASPCSCAG